MMNACIFDFDSYKHSICFNHLGIHCSFYSAKVVIKTLKCQKVCIDFDYFFFGAWQVLNTSTYVVMYHFVLLDLFYYNL